MVMKGKSKAITYCMADIHGSYKGMVQAISRSPFRPEIDTLITLGDYIDGGNHIEVLPIMEYLMALPNWIGILGNHDQMMQDAIDNGWQFVEHIWYSQGGKQTLNSLGIGTSLSTGGLYGTRVFSGDCPEICKKFLKELRLYYVDENDNAYIHAGWHKRKDRIENSHSFQFDKPDLYWNREFWQQSGSKAFLDPPYNKVFIGHTPDNSYPEKRGNVWNLDSGAGYDGKITLMRVDTEEYWQSDTTPELYENFGFR